MKVRITAPPEVTGIAENYRKVGDVVEVEWDPKYECYEATCAARLVLRPEWCEPIEATYRLPSLYNQGDRIGTVAEVVDDPVVGRLLRELEPTLGPEAIARILGPRWGVDDAS